MKVDVPTLIKRITEEASLPDKEKDMVQKFDRQQLLELYMYIKELKRTNQQLANKIQEVNGRANGESKRS